MEGGIKVKEPFIVNTNLLDYLMKNIRLISECDIQEKVHKFPYTRSVSNFFQKLEYEYDIDFDEELISENCYQR